jgi:hypothetical protein
MVSMAEQSRSAEAQSDALDALAAPEEDERPSITEVNGTVARFTMAYSPEKGDRFAFGPPLWQRAPSLLYLTLSIALAFVVFAAYHGSSNTSLYRWVVEGDRGRPLGSVPLTFLILFSAVATVVRAGMRGVIVTADGVEARYLLALGVPRIRKWTWPQIDRLVLDDKEVMLELWDGSYERLPRVKEGKALTELLERIALARNRPVTRLSDQASR